VADPSIERREPMHPGVRALFEAAYARREERVIDVQAQRGFDAASAVYFSMNAPQMAVDREIRIPGPRGDLRALVHAAREPSGEPMRGVLYLHGGGYCIMTPETHARITKTLARDADAVVVSVEYGLAPEHPLPEGLDDCVAAFRWLRAHGSELGIDPARIAVAGDSAGGGLSAATTLRLLADGDAPPEAVLLNCAWLDLMMDSPSWEQWGDDDAFIDSAVMSHWRECYAPKPAQWRDPFASPLHGDVSSVPATCVVVGALDPLRDDGVRFAEKLRAAGRTVELVEYADMPHAWTLFPTLDTTDPALARMGEWLRKTLA
jgi:acetyl esterase